jgi:hypothetical protein
MNITVVHFLVRVFLKSIHQIQKECFCPRISTEGKILNNYQEITYSFKITESVLFSVIKETCNIIVIHFGNILFPPQVSILLNLLYKVTIGIY